MASIFATLLASLLLTTSAPAATTPESDPEWSYAAMLSFYPNNANLRVATAGEIRAYPGVYPITDPKKNAAFYFAKASALISGIDPPPGSALSRLPYNGDERALSNWVARNAAALENVRAGIAMPDCAFPTMFYIDSGLPARQQIIMPQMLRVALVVSDAAFLQEVKGDPEAARQWYMAMIGMGTLMRRGSRLESGTGMTIAELGATNLARLVSNAKLSRGNLDAMGAVLRGQAVTETELKMLVANEVTTVEVDSQVQKLPEKLGAQYDFDEYIKAVHRVELEFYKSWFTVLGDGELNAVLDRLARAKPEAATEPADVFWRWRVRLAETDLLMDLESLRAAVSVFQQNKKRLPERLDELVPNFLPQVPLDPFSGQPLRYARTETGWQVWSVGYDRVDNGGVTDRPGILWAGPDFVFPSDLQSNVEFRSRGAIGRLK